MWLLHITLLVSIGLANCECPGENVFEEIAGTCYYFSSDRDETADWQGARTICQDMGSLLGMKVDLSELGAEASCMSDGLLMERIAEKGKLYTWLGGTDSSNEGTWHWASSGRSLSIMDSRWLLGDPNGDQKENCLNAVVIGSYHRSYLNDFTCGSVDYFVCQIL
ncbi:unnamed protein product [Meganyctiphanes norvegica]|uniref:C-type lectin domain-containing protein n=1 Tax=Meganyctiphanes norvegica TaxID=48144 RepID=A0AAV2QZ53_MEGNR